MSDPTPPLKNPSRVPAISQIADPVGQAMGGVGVTITPSMIDPPAGQAIGEESPVSERNDIVETDGVYEDAEKNRFQYRSGHQLPAGTLKTLKRVDSFPKQRGQGEEELEATKAPKETAAQKKAREAQEADAKAKADADAKAAQEAENKKAPEPENKSS